MKIALFFLIVLLFFSCYKKEKISFETKKNASTILFDTLVFSEEMNGDLLNNKFIAAKPKLEFYKKFINQNSVNKIKTITDEHTKTEIVYLGILNDLNNVDCYHVFTNFKIIGIGEILSPRGISEVAFINTKNNKIITYDFPMSDELPKSIENNSLYFEFENTKILISVLDGFAPYLCIPKIGCY